MPMFRIMMARNGYYYVQKDTWNGYKKIGGFFSTERGARKFINDYRRDIAVPYGNRVIGYA